MSEPTEGQSHERAICPCPLNTGSGSSKAGGVIGQGDAMTSRFSSHADFRPTGGGGTSNAAPLLNVPEALLHPVQVHGY